MKRAIRLCMLFLMGAVSWPVYAGWSLVGATIIGRASHTATLLDDGRVLITGGETVDVGLLSVHHFRVPENELYDPVNGTFTQTGALHTARARHTASRLPDGRVLIVGGEASDPEITAEIY